MTTTVHVLVEPAPLTGATNMARDEALLEHVVAGGEPWLRWYQWCEPTLSLGYFQSEETAPVPLEMAHLPRVRRLSGGGAILHDRELTYSLVLPATHPLTEAPSALYALIHNAIVHVLNEHGCQVALRGTAFGPEAGPEAFLCFSRGDANDVVWGQHKVLGSAQRRRKGAVLQHGSLVYAASPAAPQFPGLFDLGNSIPLSGLQLQLVDTTAIVCGTPQIVDDFPPTLQQRAQQLEAERYSHLDWGKPGLDNRLHGR